MKSWFIGCSGFHYRHWKETFYPKGLPQRKWFDYYSEHFKTLELNVTFYRFPQLSFLENWYQKSPSDFCFSVKAPRLITHYKQFNESRQLLADFYGTIAEGLQEKLGCILFQLPPKTTFTEERLQKIIDNLDPAYQNVLEFRHVSWWNEVVYNTFAQHKITFCGMSHPDLPTNIIHNTSVLYYRLHGVPQLYKSPYSEEELVRIADEINGAPDVQQAYIYFNNDIDASAIGNARQMQEYCLGQLALH
ncbi:DUF72 domain-containing protein [Hymenobacter jejuensis]|uniref:DUF72 domain-containing protein n=1 Tax=Hymenobacter jejuensis TaxID=2502781 RepID=A0A5B7ZXC8_9BACT|nr:DUF72 domain-containing protein [Hymenobacter jejuensis]QDA59527.1 DUF72 domain-containing protein [Hymenobacter jejuensis]